FKRYPSGHCYFTLKDAGAVLKCVMFRSKAVSLRFQPQNGDTVVAVGRLAVYERDGVYQLYTDLLLQQGVGDLMQAYEKLKQKLERAGLFAPERKQQLPLHPRTVGIITSPAGAAVRDIITVSRRRNQGIKLLLYPVKVQGEGAAAEIAAAIEFFNRKKLADVLIVGRGGGSIEDLWAFNEEITVRAVAASKIPVVSAVGHETDFTLCDFAADVRAATPSQAAELVVADVEGYKQHVAYLEQRARSLLSALLTQQQRRLDNLVNSWALRDPERLFADQSQRLDTASRRLREALELHLQQDEHKLALAAARLDSLSPLAVLGRGYSVSQKSDYTLVSSVDDLRWGDELLTTVADGVITSVVQQVERR
ncbi:exodeoxyribonuclease VII large subunit, partial [Phascolarctobacterium succinatutens]